MRPPAPFVVVAQGWPNSLITISLLKLWMDRAFFPAQFHTLFKQLKLSGIGWNVVSKFNPALFINAMFSVSGKQLFVNKILSLGDFAYQSMKKGCKDSKTWLLSLRSWVLGKCMGQ